jgi:hypothetical protein
MLVSEFQLEFCGIVEWKSYTKFSGEMYFVPCCFTLLLAVFY